MPAVGYVVSGTSRVAFFGDTDVFDGLSDLAGDLDVAMLPVWGWGPRVGPGHLDPERAARATALLAPRIAVPIHWGTLARAGVRWRADPEMPARRFAELVAAGVPAVTVRILQPGERLELRPKPERDVAGPGGPAPDQHGTFMGTSCVRVRATV